MNNSNYYVGVDENGQPYIAHASSRPSASSDGGGRGRHKYMAKFENFFNNGKAFYAYTQEQVRQAMNRGRNKAKSQLNFRAKQIKTRAGVAKRELSKAANRAKLNISKTADKARRDLEFRGKQIKTRAGVAERAINKAADHIKKHATETLGNIKSQLNFRGKQIKTRAGVAERAINKAADQVKKHGNETLGDIKSQLAFKGKQIETRAGVAQREAGKAVNKAVNNYIENSKEKKALDDAEKNLNRAVEDYKHATNLSAAATKRLDSARDNMRDTSKALSDALDKYEKARGTDDELSAYYDYQSAKKASDKASNEYRTVLRNTVENNPRHTANTDKASASIGEYTRQLQNARMKYNDSLAGLLDRNVNKAQRKNTSGHIVIDKSRGKKRVYTVK